MSLFDRLLNYDRETGLAYVAGLVLKTWLRDLARCKTPLGFVHDSVPRSQRALTSFTTLGYVV